MENKRIRRQPTEAQIRAAESIRRAVDRTGDAPSRSFNILDGMDISPKKRDPELEINKRINERLQQPGETIPNTNDDYSAQSEKMSADDIIRASEERTRQALLKDAQSSDMEEPNDEDDRRQIRMRLLQEAAKTGAIPNHLKKY